MGATEVSDLGLKAIKKFEGWRCLSYKDCVGKETIGYGHLVKTGECFGPITPVEGNTLLNDDADEACKAVLRLVKVDLNQGQLDALVSFVFNLGEGNLASSTLLRKLNASDFDGACDEFIKWCHAGGVVVEGILQRRKAEQTMFKDGVYPLNQE